MADVVDNNKEYIVGTSGNYITKRRKNVMDIIKPTVVSNAVVLTEDMTGSVVVLPDSGADTDVITLPTTPVEGTNFEFVFGTDLTATFVMAGKFQGQITDGGGIQDVASATSVSILKSTTMAGDRLSLVYIGDTWYLSGQFVTAAAMSAA